jgi:hypothetical protein
MDSADVQVRRGYEVGSILASGVPESPVDLYSIFVPEFRVSD